MLRGWNGSCSPGPGYSRTLLQTCCCAKALSRSTQDAPARHCPCLRHGGGFSCSAVLLFAVLGLVWLLTALATHAHTYMHVHPSQTPWNRRRPLDFSNAEKTIVTTLCCAKNKGLWLPLELWQHVFWHLSRKDFGTDCEFDGIEEDDSEDEVGGIEEEDSEDEIPDLVDF
eukprot:m.170259 g.170259  ORF g.170259 m.170259 type:complete len:170 (+) comp10376_c0_seq6:1081-1590(+)